MQHCADPAITDPFYSDSLEKSGKSCVTTEIDATKIEHIALVACRMLTPERFDVPREPGHGTWTGAARAEGSSAFARLAAAASRLLSGARCQRASIVARIDVVS